MKTLPLVLHLVDDTTAGGVMRALDFIRSDSALAWRARHEVKAVACDTSGLCSNWRIRVLTGLCVSNGQAVWMVTRRLVHADKVFTIPPCVDLALFREMPAPKEPARVVVRSGVWMIKRVLTL